MASILGLVLLVVLVLSLVFTPVLVVLALAGGAVYLVVYTVLVLGSSQ